ncbi:N-acetyltransferase family protein [Faecalibacillus intestinalis]
MDNAVKIRYATKEDVPLILQFIKDLAEYEKMSDEVIANEALLEEWLFDKQKAEVIFLVAQQQEVGFALFFHNFSTFQGRSGYLSRRPFCQTSVSWMWVWKNVNPTISFDRRRKRLRSHGMVLSELEPTKYSLLLITRSSTNEGVDDISFEWTSPGRFSKRRHEMKIL